MLSYDHKKQGTGAAGFITRFSRRQLATAFFPFLITQAFSSEMVQKIWNRGWNVEALKAITPGSFLGWNVEFSPAFLWLWMSPGWQGAGLRQPWLLFQEGSSCCLATTQTWWLFVYSSSCAKLKLRSQIIAFNNNCIQNQSCNRWIRKRIFL